MARFVSTSKPASGGAHVVGDDEVDPLGRQLLGRVLADALGLGREADQHLAAACSRRARRGCPASARARSPGSPSRFFSFSAAIAFGPEVRDRGGHHDDVDVREPGQHLAVHVLGRLDRDDLDGRRRPVAPACVTSVTAAPRLAATSATA